MDILPQRRLLRETPILSPFANCARNKSLGIDFTTITNVHDAYKNYLCERWKNDKLTPVWKGGAIDPKWRKE